MSETGISSAFVLRLAVLRKQTHAALADRQATYILDGVACSRREVMVRGKRQGLHAALEAQPCDAPARGEQQRGGLACIAGYARGGEEGRGITFGNF